MLAIPLMKALGAIHLLEKVIVEVNLKSDQKAYFELQLGLTLHRLKNASKKRLIKYRNHISMSPDSLIYCFCINLEWKHCGSNRDSRP